MHSELCIVVYLSFDLFDVIFTPIALYSVVDYDLSFIITQGVTAASQ